MDGLASRCQRHNVVFVWVAPGTARIVREIAGDDGEMLRVIDVITTGVKWRASNYFAEMFGVACNCEAAKLCPRIARMSAELVNAVSHLNGPGPKEPE